MAIVVKQHSLSLHNIRDILGCISIPSLYKSSLEPRLSVLDFVLQLWRKLQDKIRNREPGLEASITLYNPVILRMNIVHYESHDAGHTIHHIGIFHLVFCALTH